MSADLDALKVIRREFVESMRKNVGFEDGIKRLLTELYPDNAHFIYELLQNAEDARATVVRFMLTPDGLDFEHNGSRLFTLENVESITSIAVSSKRDDPTSIGKFGVGFKAVFAYTSSPEIHSGEYDFRIDDLVVPETKDIKRPNMNERETKFIFPFNHAKKKPQEAVTEISLALRELGDSTLLFLSNIRKIEYLLPDGALGSLERIDPGHDRIAISSKHPGGSEGTSNWLRFFADVSVDDDDDGAKTKLCRVAIAFSIANDPKMDTKSNGGKIVPVERGQVSIFFPADKETSNLRFHLHAPFASTVARDSVRDCKANTQLRAHLAQLVVDSLSIIRDQGFLTVDFLSVLPIAADNVDKHYLPIQKAIIKAFNEGNLTPTRKGGHAPAKKLLKGPAAIANVLDDTDLARLLGEPYKAPLWAANAPQVNQREDRFLESLDVTAWDWSSLAGLVNCFIESDDKAQLEAWIAEQTDAKLLLFYGLLGTANDRPEISLRVRRVHIVRVDHKGKSEHVVPSAAFFPPESDAKAPEDVRFVKEAVYRASRSELQKRQAESFLKAAGVKPFDESDRMKRLLEKYESKEPVDIDESYYADIGRFVAFLKKGPSWAEMFEKPAFLLARDAKGALVRRSPTSLCIDSPYLETGLTDFMSVHGKLTLHESYQEKLSDTAKKDFLSFLQNLNVMFQLSVERESTLQNPAKGELRQDYNQPGVRLTDTCIDNDHSIPGLSKYLARQSLIASRLVWMAITRATKDAAKAYFRPNRSYALRSADSQLICYLKSTAWIPDRDGVFHKPQDITQELLRSDFPYDERNGLLVAIGFGENVRKKSEHYKNNNVVAQSWGIPSFEIAERFGKLLHNGLTIEDCEAIVQQRQRPALPKESVPDPARRRKAVLERRDNAQDKESVTLERSIQPGAPEATLEARAYLRAKYTNEDGNLICQCCGNIMPFKINGQYYFEAIQSVRRLEKHHREARLALCPTCAAKYQYARETNDVDMRSRILEAGALDTAPSVEVPVRLAGADYQLHFVGTHWFDLKVVLAGNEAN